MRERARRAVQILPLMPKVLFCAGLVELSLRVMPLAEVCTFLQVRLLMEPPDPSCRVATVHDVSSRDQVRLRAVRVVYRHWPVARDRQCLRFSLVAGQLLREADPCLRIGVNRFEGRFVAHAWLVLDGDLQLDSSAVLYQPLTASRT